jgi:hypothetical protein
MSFSAVDTTEVENAQPVLPLETFGMVFRILADKGMKLTLLNCSLASKTLKSFADAELLRVLRPLFGLDLPRGFDPVQTLRWKKWISAASGDGRGMLVRDLYLSFRNGIEANQTLLQLCQDVTGVEGLDITRPEHILPLATMGHLRRTRNRNRQTNISSIKSVHLSS